MYTTIQINKNTRARLNKLRFYQRATYDEIISALMDLVPEGDDEGKYTSEFRSSLLRSLIDVKHKKTHSAEAVRERFGV